MTHSRQFEETEAFRAIWPRKANTLKAGWKSITQAWIAEQPEAVATKWRETFHPDQNGLIHMAEQRSLHGVGNAIDSGQAKGVLPVTPRISWAESRTQGS